mgnify:CR=1 FL=1
MRQIFRTVLVLTALLLIACASVAVKSFSVNNLTQCQDTGACELFLELTVDGRSFQPSRDYPSASSQDHIDIDWGDGSTFSDSVRNCVDESICSFVNGGLLLYKNFELGSGFFTSVHLNGENFKNLQGDTAFGTFSDRADTRFVSFNTGLADTQVDYYSGRKELMVENLIDLDADVLCLQEVWKGRDMQEIRDGLAQKFPHTYTEMQDDSPFKWAWGHNGLMILSRYPLENKTFKELDHYFLRRSILSATVDTPLQGQLEVGCTHLSTAINFPPYLGSYESWEDEQNQQARDIVAWKEFDVLMGDFNASPAAPGINAYTPEAYNIITASDYFSPVQDSVAGCTWCVDNPIASDEDGDLILDHIFFSGDFAGHNFESSTLFTDELTVRDFWGQSQKTWLSDHAGIMVIVD